MQKANRYIKRCWTSLFTREMQIKGTMRYHFTPARITVIKKTKDYTWWHAYGEKGTIMHCGGNSDQNIIQ